MLLLHWGKLLLYCLILDIFNTFFFKVFPTGYVSTVDDYYTEFLYPKSSPSFLLLLLDFLCEFFIVCMPSLSL